MTRENATSTPIFDQLLSEMVQRAESEPSHPEPETRSAPTEQPPTPRRRHRAE